MELTMSILPIEIALERIIIDPNLDANGIIDLETLR
jgi:hypothetical protein